MKNPILIVIPTLRRPSGLAQCIESFISNGTDLSDFLVITRDTDGWVNALKSVPMELIDRYEVLGIMNDDVRMRTRGWDQFVQQRLRGRTALLYGRDGHQDQKLCTQPFISSRAVIEVGRIGPIELRASLVDNFWMEIFQNIGRLDYQPFLYTEHLHPHVGKSSMDSTYSIRHSQFGPEWELWESKLKKDIPGLAGRIRILPEQPRNKVVSFSLWGKDPMYLRGAEPNARLGRLYYPGWTLRAYCEPNHAEFLNQLGYEVHVRTITRGAWEGLFWRLEPACDPEVDIFVSRDFDSRLNPREAAAVNQWISSGLFAHVMRDHPWHDVPMLAGMWGCRRDEPFAEWFSGALKNWPRMGSKGDDTAFMAEWVWPRVRHGCVIHDSIHQAEGIQPFPPHEPMDPTIFGNFVGAIMP